MEKLPINFDFETKPILKALTNAHRVLAELKGIVNSIPNQQILIETLILREAKESSAIENIISTMDEVYQSSILDNRFLSVAAKEVHKYAAALKEGYVLVRENDLLTNTTILTIQQVLEENSAGFRTLPGTKLMNDKTGEVVYMPPQDNETIIDLMQNLEQYINDDALQHIDPLIKMAIIHHRFESIHPFYDGNGRTGRIINILYLVQKKLLELPILYLSKFIIATKATYYKLLQEVRDLNKWEEWILYILQGVEQTAMESIKTVTEIRELMQEIKNELRNELPKLYSQDLINNLFKYPYTKIEYLQKDLNISNRTAIRYLDSLVEVGILIKIKKGRVNFYLNERLFSLLSYSKNTN